MSQSSEGLVLQYSSSNPIQRGESSVSNFGASFAITGPTHSTDTTQSTTGDVLLRYGNFFLCRTRSIKDFQCYLSVVLLLNFLYVASEVLGCAVIGFVSKSIFLDAEITLLALALLFSVVDTTLVLFLIYRRSRNLCVAAFFCMVTADILYSCQLALVTAHDASETLAFGIFFVVAVIGLSLQIFPLLVTYRFVYSNFMHFLRAFGIKFIVLRRYWEYLMYNYDPSEDGRLRERKSDFPSRYNSRDSANTTFTVDIVLDKLTGSAGSKNSIVADNDLKLSQEFNC